MGDHDRLDACVDGGVDDDEDLRPREMPGRQDEVVPRDDVEHLEQLRQRRAVGVEHGHRLRAHARRAQLELEADPDRDLAVGVGVLDLAELVLGADGGQPDDPRALARGDLDGGRVEPADRVVERDRAERPDARNRRGDDRCTLGRGRVVRLQTEPASPSSRQRSASSRSVIRRGAKSGATWTCGSNPPRTSSRARSDGTGCQSSRKITRSSTILLISSATVSDPTLTRPSIQPSWQASSRRASGWSRRSWPSASG